MPVIWHVYFELEIFISNRMNGLQLLLNYVHCTANQAVWHRKLVCIMFLLFSDIIIKSRKCMSAACSLKFYRTERQRYIDIHIISQGSATHEEIFYRPQKGVKCSQYYFNNNLHFTNIFYYNLVLLTY